MIGVIVSAIIYGGVLSLTLSYALLLLKTSNDISRRMRNFLLVYDVTFMVALSTVYMITISIALIHSIFDYPHSLEGVQYPGFKTDLWVQYALRSLVGVADGFMVSKDPKSLLTFLS